MMDIRARPRRWFPALVLCIGLSLTLLASFSVSRSISAKYQATFQADATELVVAIKARMESYLALLRGVAALSASHPDLSRQQFHVYVDRLRVPEIYPGIQGIGYSPRVLPGKEAEVIGWMQRQGVTGFHLWPEGTRDERFAIIYLEPEDRRNLAAIGYDMFSESVRREAMEKARDSGMPSLSGTVKLVQEIEGPEQPGFLVYVPVYFGGEVPTTLEARRRLLAGFSYAPFRAHDFFNSFSQSVANTGLGFAVYDTREPRSGALLFSASGPGSGRPRTVIPIQIAGRDWAVQIWAKVPGRWHWQMFAVVLAGGTILSLLLFYFTSAEAGARALSEAAVERLRRSEQALRESEQKLRLMIENVRDYAIFSLDPQGRISSWNPGAQRVFFYEEKDVMGKPAAVIFTPEDRASGETERELKVAAESGACLDERWHLRKDGSRFFASGVVHSIRDAGGELVGFIKVARDITASWEAQQKLVREKRFSEAIISSLPGIFYLFNNQGRILRWNANFENITGYSGEEIGKMGPLDFIATPDRDRIAKAIGEVFSGKHVMLQSELIGKDQASTPFLFTGSAISLDGVPCLIGTGMDISEQKQAEASLLEARKKLEAYATTLEVHVRERTTQLRESLASLEGVLYHVAHDLRAPLRAISSFISVLLDEYAPKFDAAGADLAHRVQRAAQRMDELVLDLLAYGRLAHIDLPLQRVNLRRHVESALAQVDSEIQASSAQVLIRPPLPDVMANSAVLKDVLVQLLHNAVKFNPPGTTPKVEIFAQDGAFVRLWIQDNGIGIAPEFHDRIFRVFERLHGAEVYSGTGIGLAIVQKGVERMGGRVGVESALGKGSLFWIELRAAGQD